jgi:hypothetical protein
MHGIYVICMISYVNHQDLPLKNHCNNTVSEWSFARGSRVSLLETKGLLPAKPARRLVICSEITEHEALSFFYVLFGKVRSFSQHILFHYHRCGQFAQRAKSCGLSLYIIN